MAAVLPKFFRSVNSLLITTDNVVVEKILKVFLAVSVKFYHNARKKKRESSDVVIDNFDSNIKMKIDPSRSMGAAIYWTGFHEFREFLFLHRYLKNDMVFADVGANQGEYALFAAKRLMGGQVLAFEPLPSIRTVLMDNIQLNGFDNIKVFDCGLSSEEGTLQIHEIEDVHEGLATFYPGERKSRKSFSVPLKTLDDIFTTNNFSRLDFIKIDIEGGELKALQGSKAVIQKYRPVVMIEINEETYRAAGYSSQDVARFFAALGYQPFTIKKRGRLEKCSALPTFGNVIYQPQ